ncbi:hypothetical protein BAUCODRAFT_151472 [Baudoinia panamericana UAMH 10762]|uniref:Uncharacterized protein n=1 Tax=Baudoinia panamericana (strain UAMH 10762) TaxID=717646 RepID=M2N2A1_BAUPA|nr:uncharacterized protein BAUCODRAFT_151472 [Baudoinia panamericana UAMH 10762]EMC93109.1 hypothetical protein BAUCODRAFT_151472 [Baudoinia panamericana UAMH 10762]
MSGDSSICKPSNNSSTSSRISPSKPKMRGAELSRLMTRSLKPSLTCKMTNGRRAEMTSAAEG